MGTGTGNFFKWMTAGVSAKKKRGGFKQRRIVIAGGVVTLFFLYLMLYPPSALRTLEYAGYDEMVRLLGGTLPPTNVVVVDVDERSLARMGQWPWPRYRIAEMIQKCADLGAYSIAVDFLFSEPDRLSLDKVSELYRSELGISVDFGDTPVGILDNDRYLADTISGRHVVLGSDMVFTETREHYPENCGKNLNVALLSSSDTVGGPQIPQGYGMVCPLPELSEAAYFVGAANALPDQDGKVRRAPLLLRSGDNWIPGIAFAAILAAWEMDQVILQWSEAGVLELRVGRTVIPTDYQGNLLLPFRVEPPDRFNHISAVDLLEGRIESGDLKGKLVFIGSSASGLNDMHATPNMRACPGIDLHAMTADALLRRDFVVEPGWSKGIQVITVLLSGLLVTILMAWAPVTLGALMTGGAAAMLAFGFWYLFNRWGIYCSPVPGINTLLAGCTLLTLVRLRSEERYILEQTRRLAISQDCALLGLVSIAETRDPETGKHIVRTQHFVRILAEYLSRLPRFRNQLKEDDIDALFKSAPLHDAGKVGVPDNILLKPGKLSEEEYEKMKSHTIRGYEVLKQSEEMSGVTQDMSFLRYAKEVSRSHHERWDGTGYPDGLKGEEIPLSARLMALADVYDALRAKRSYKPPMSHAEARKIICEGDGSHFDPAVVDAFLHTEKAFQAIMNRYADTEEIPGHD
ncbi:MAG: CHASE2 domain-containing protein [Candidatus Hydrogenedentes bacterium]|nr:CHASE2 domain-containing protein [Candidatus Hydrogenedentota bacterium]